MGGAAGAARGRNGASACKLAGPEGFGLGALAAALTNPCALLTRLHETRGAHLGLWRIPKDGSGLWRAGGFWVPACGAMGRWAGSTGRDLSARLLPERTMATWSPSSPGGVRPVGRR